MKKLTFACLITFTLFATGCDTSFILNGEELSPIDLLDLLNP